MSNTQSLRLVLWAALAIALWFNYRAWLTDYGNAPAPSTAVSGTAHGGGAAPNLGSAVPQAANGAAASRGSQSAATTSGAVAPTTTPATSSAEAAQLAGSGVVHVHTDVLDAEISERGGTLVKLDLTKYPRVKGQPEPVELENHANPETLYVLQTGLTGPSDQPHPTQNANFTSAQTDYGLPAGGDTLSVPLTWTDEHGVTVTKTFVFRRGSYRIDVPQVVQNHSEQPWEAAQYAQILRNDPPTKRTMFNVESYAFHGPAIFDGAKYRTLKLTDAENRNLSLATSDGWLAAPQHHFVSAVVPPAGVPYRYTLNIDANEFALATAGPQRVIPPGGSQTFELTLFTGPKLQAQLAVTSPRLTLVADYGRLTILAGPLFKLLQFVYGVFHNWGVAIIIVTFLLKLLFYPLSEASGRSMAKMKALAPRIKALQENYKDDREKAGRAMMELYQREKVNPVAGCLPTVIQIPVFLAFYWVLLESVEMRQAPFFGWINDLSSRDPYFILPAIMAAAMFVQYKLNPAPPDPVQARVMMIMPLAMSVMFAFFPAGLVLYWVTNTVLSIAQQWNINRRIEAAAAAKKS